MTHLEKIINGKLEVIERTLKHLVDYQDVFEYSFEREEEWNDLQELIRELTVRHKNLQDLK